jgi:hypothetical protein
MRACLIMMGISLPLLAHAQSGVDVSPAIPVHPDVPTILRLPDELVRVWFMDSGALLVHGTGNQVYVRPRPDTPPGVEEFVEVETRTLHRVFLVRVTERAEDAMPEVVVPPAAAAECVEDAGGDAISAPLMEPPTNEPGPAPAPASADPGPGPASIEPAAEHASEPITERAGTTPHPRLFDLTVHVALAMPGFTALEIRGHAPGTTLRPHLGLGLRIAATRIDSRWGFEINVNGEWPAGPMLYDTMMERPKVDVSGPWLRAEGGMRIQLERAATWMATAYAGGGLQAHLRQSMSTNNNGVAQLITTMENGAVLALGVGLHYRTRNLVLGVDFQARGGGPDDYRSIEALWTFGYRLNQGE